MPRLTQQAEAPLVLEHQAHAPAQFSQARDFLVYQSAHFF